jgi:hypothetical protein
MGWKVTNIADGKCTFCIAYIQLQHKFCGPLFPIARLLGTYLDYLQHTPQAIEFLKQKGTTQPGKTNS